MSKASVTTPRHKVRSSSFVSYVIVGAIAASAGHLSCSCQSEIMLRVPSGVTMPVPSSTWMVEPEPPAIHRPPSRLPPPRSCPTNKGQHRQRR